jgi:hypothetical protein
MEIYRLAVDHRRHCLLNRTRLTVASPARACRSREQRSAPIAVLVTIVIAATATA